MVRFWCPIAQMKATTIPLHMLLDLSKNIYFSKSYSRKLFVIKKAKLDFLKNIFKKLFKKSKILIFEKIIFLIFFWKVNENRKFQNFEKPKFWIFENFFFETFFFENRVEFFWPQKVFGCNFWKNKYFFTNPKAYEADCPWLPFPLLDIKNGPLRKTLSPKNLGGVF